MMPTRAPRRPLLPMAVNTAEAVIDPFWDPQLSGLADWTVRPAARCGLRVAQDWSHVRFEWVDRPPAGPVLRMRLGRPIDCDAYDRLILVLAAPPLSIVSLAADTDHGERRIERLAEPMNKMEVVLPLRGARRIRAIRIEIVPGSAGAAAGTLSWIGLRHSRRMRDHRARWQTPPPVPEKQLRPLPSRATGRPAVPPAGQPLFSPSYGIFLTAAELRCERRDPRRLGWARSVRRRAAGYVPETLCNECLVVANYMDNRYNRVDHHQRPTSIEAAELGRAGLILEDARLLQLAARTALAKAMSPVWEENRLCDFPGGIWEHRAFTHTQLLLDLAAALDLAGAAFSEAGRDYLLRRMAEVGLGRANFVAWKHEYTYHNNQLAAFSPGRVAAYAVIERHWPRARPYLDQALEELNANFEYILLPDGGYAEGPSYFAYGVGSGMHALELAARARNLALTEIVPERLKQTANMAVCLGSTDDACDMIPFGDAMPGWSAAALARFAALAPGGGWSWLEQRARAREAGRPMPAIPWPAFIRLPDMGAVASHRRWKKHWVKIFVAGCVRDADHNHEDKGGFVLEYAGETLAIDPGVRRYKGTAAAALLKQVDFHNMLVPYGSFSERPHPRLPHPTQPWPEGIAVEGQGTVTAFNARVNAARGYETYFKKWIRTFTSASPGELVIRDDYGLTQGDGVEFLWQTHQAVEIGESVVTVRGRRGQALISIPAGCRATVETVASETNDRESSPVVHRRIRIRKPGRRGVLAIAVRLEPVDRSR